MVGLLKAVRDILDDYQRQGRIVRANGAADGYVDDPVPVRTQYDALPFPYRCFAGEEDLRDGLPPLIRHQPRVGHDFDQGHPVQVPFRQVMLGPVASVEESDAQLLVQQSYGQRDGLQDLLIELVEQSCFLV